MPLNRPLLNMKIPPAKYLGLWQTDLLAPRDSIVKLYAQACEGTTNEKPLLEVKCHKVVLQEGSDLMKQQLEAFQAGEGQQLTVIPLLCPANLPCNKEGAAAVEAVLRFCYTHELPENASVGTVINVALAAHYLEVAFCIQACIQALNRIPESRLSVKDVNQLLDAISLLPDLASAMDILSLWKILPDSEPLKNADQWTSFLKAMFGDVNAVLSQPQLLDKFALLPLRAVEVWGSMDTIKVSSPMFGSENDIVALLSYWWHKQPVRMHTAATQQRLSSLVRLPLLSHNYLLHVLPAQPWFVVPPGLHTNYKEVCFELQHGGKASPKSPYFAGLNVKARLLAPMEDREAAIITVNETSETIEIFLQEYDQRLTWSRHWRGFVWELYLERQVIRSYQCRVAVRARLPHYMHLPEQPTFVSADVNIKCNLANVFREGHVFVVPQVSDCEDRCFGTTLDFGGKELFPRYLEPNKTYRLSATISAA